MPVSVQPKVDGEDLVLPEEKFTYSVIRRIIRCFLDKVIHQSCSCFSVLLILYLLIILLHNSNVGVDFL